MKTLISILTALLLLGASPVLAGERGGGEQHGGRGCGGGCGGGGGHYPGGGNINVNVNAHANAYAGAYINARAYDVRAIRGAGGYGGVVSTGGGGPVDYGYGVVGYGPVVVRGPGYGPSRPFGYVAQGFGRRYVTTDRCCGLRPAACYDNCGGGYQPPPPPACDCRSHGSSQGGGYGYDARSHSGRSVASYSVRESYSESSSYSGGYQGGYEHDDRDVDQGDDGPRYAPVPYQASPLEPIPYDQGGDDQGYAPPPIHYSQPAYPEPAYAEPQVYEPAPAYVQPPQDYYGDLPPGDTGDGYSYRQEPGERG